MRFTVAKERETFWHLSQLTVILAIAACVRFYQLDYLSLSANEIANIGVCNASNWLGLAVNQRVLNGMPFVYPFLLCDTTAWLGNSEFMVRLPSALAGTAVIFVIYRIGRDFFSPVSGLLSAALIATAHTPVVASRETDLYAFLLLFVIFHTYCFFHIVFTPDNAAAAPVSIQHRGASWNLAWSWRSGFAGKEGFLLGFWCSGALAFYTSYMAAIPLAMECIVTLFYLRKPAAVALWKPLLVVIALWIPILLSFWKWISTGHFFTLQDTGRIKQIIRALFIENSLLLNVLLASAALTLVLCLVQRFSRNTEDETTSCSAFFICLLFLAGMLTAFFLPSISTNNYIFWSAIFFLIAPYPVAILIRHIPLPALQQTLVIILLIGITALQTRTLYDNGAFTHEVNADFRLATKIVHDDKNFMEGNRTIILNSGLFNHYLERFDLKNAVHLQANSESAEDTLHGLLADNVFYYLEYQGSDRNLEHDSPLYTTLSSRYRQLCQSRIPWVRIIKFSGVDPEPGTSAPDCQAHLAGVVSL
ncbi:MAG TPA: glycosyltransferase family 39 protein [Pseudomonadales bacterium]|nr:glycosyltransferase family 39 protein [Pseudomonadales bacterium]